MKKSTVETIEKKFEKDFENISSQLRDNKRKIKDLAEEQTRLKTTRRGLFEILRLIRKN